MRHALLLLAAAGLLPACQPERTNPREMPPPLPASMEHVRTSELVPGGSVAGVDRPNPFSGIDTHIHEGERLWGWFNCSGCHAGGGGGIGPPLMDEKWIYGRRPAQVYASIVSGRPNGMPAFGGLIQPQQVWQLVAYIESMGGMKGEDDQRSGGGPFDPPPKMELKPEKSEELKEQEPAR